MSAASDATIRLANRPWLALAVAVAVLLVVFYAVFLRQELFFIIWVLLVGFFAYLALRFVRAHERIASAAERMARDAE